uniref:Ig-like domain-containing protein n=1 Tax=Timema cristinae TaxID=61476 RepID=A0A7R9CMS2_TIMCR|nr:unnamed protein product [Timema cristinae]
MANNATLIFTLYSSPMASLVLTDSSQLTSDQSTFRTRGEQELLGDRYRVSENNNTVHLSLHHVTREDGGVYTLVAKNAAGEARRAVKLLVAEVGGGGEEVPTFVRRLTDLAVKVGTRTRFTRRDTVSWHKNDRLVEEGERFHFLHEGTFFCVDVAPVMVEDGGRWTCMAESSGGRSSCSSHLNVLVPKAYKNPEFLEELRALLTEQGTVSLECKVVGVPTPVLKWYKDGKEIKAGDVFALTANPDDPTSLGTYTCEAVNCMGKTYSSSRVHVMGKGSREGSLRPADSLKPVGPPPIFAQELRNEKVKIGDTATLSCQVAVPPWPQSISWYNKEGRVDQNDKYHVMEDGLGGYNLEIHPLAVPPWPQSISWYNKEGRVDQNDKYHVMEDGLGGYNLEIHPCEVVDEGEWKCVATSALGMKGISRCILTVTYPKNYRRPRFLESLKAILTEEGLVSFECKVVGYPTPQLRWFKDGQELKPGDVYQLTGTNSLGSYSCIAKNCMGETTSSAELTVEDIQNQLNEEEKLQLFSTNQPPKFVRGLKSSEAKIDEDFRFTVQGRLTDTPPSHLMVPQAEWKCVATNDFGHSVTSCFLKLNIPRHFKKPRFLECLQAVLSEEGAVNLECKVIGVPQPVLKWYKDGEELKPGDIHRIISGQDGTCCLGTYTCEAQNCMGVVSSSASLLGFEERRTRKSSDLPKLDISGGVIPGGHTIVRNPSLSTIHEERTSQMYDTPATERSLTVDERADISFSFDGREVSVSLYETPDLTEEEALQVVEMYADELSENVSEHNIVELPPLRFVKETSNTRNLLMEAVIIDVTPDYFSSADDDLRTDADLEEFSITDENGHQFSALTPDVEDDALVFEKINSELRERSIAPPKRPPRRKNEANRQKYDEQMNHDSDTFHSFSQAKEASERHSPKEDTDKSEHFTDAVGETSDSQSIADTFMSAKESPGAHKIKKEEFAYKISIIEENKEKSIGELQTTKSSPAELVRNITMETVNDKPKPDKLDEHKPDSDISKLNKKKEEVKTLEEGKANTLSNLEATPKPTKKKRKSQDVVKNESLVGTKDEHVDGDIGSLKKERLSRTIKKCKSTEKSDQEPQDTIEPESNEAMGQDYPQKIVLSLGIECPADKTKSTESLKSKESSVEKDNSYSEEGDGLKTFNKRKEKSTKKRKGSVGEGVESNKARKRSAIKKAPPIETDEHKMEVEQTFTAAKTGDSKPLKRKDSKKTPSLDSNEQNVARDDGVVTAEEESHIKKRKESKRSPSVESNENKFDIDETMRIVKGEENSTNISAVDSSKQTESYKRTICDSTGESPKETKHDTSKIRKTKKQRTISSTEAELPKLAALGIGHTVEVDTMAAKIEPTLLESLTQSLLDIQRSLVSVEEKIISQSTNEPHAVMSSLSVLETLTQPIQDSIALVEEQAALESSSEEHSLGKTSTAILETISQPMQEFQRGLALVEKQAAFEESKASLLEITSLSILENVAQPVQELNREIVFIQEQAAIHQAESGISKKMIIPSFEAKLLQDKESADTDTLLNISFLECVINPVSELQKEIEILKEQAVMETNREFLAEKPSTTVLVALSKPLRDLQKGISLIAQQAEYETLDSQENKNISKTTLNALIQPLEELNANVRFIEQQASLETEDTFFPLISKFMIVKSLAEPIQELSHIVSSIQQHYVQEPIFRAVPYRDVSPVTQIFAQSLEELKKEIEIVKNIQLLSENIPSVSETEKTTIFNIVELLQPLTDLQNGLSQSQKLFTGKLIGQDSEKALFDERESLMRHISRPSIELQDKLSKIEYLLSNAIDSSSSGTIIMKESLALLKEPVQELKINIADIHQISFISSGSDTDTVKFIEATMAHLNSPLKAFTNVLSDIEQHIAIESASTFESSNVNPKFVKSLAQSIKELECNIATIDKQKQSENNSFTKPNEVTEIQELKEPLLELKEGLVKIMQDIILEENLERGDETPTSGLITLVQPLGKLEMCLALTEGKLEKELNTHKQTRKSSLSSAKTLIQPIQQLHRDIVEIQQLAILSTEGFGTESTLDVLSTLEKPLQNLHRALDVVEKSQETPQILSALQVENVVQSIQTIQESISKLEHLSHQIPGENGLEILANLSAPLKYLENNLLEGEEILLQEENINITSQENMYILQSLSKPLKEFHREMVKLQNLAIEIQSTPESLSTISISTSIIEPLNKLEHQIEIVTKQAKAVITDKTHMRSIYLIDKLIHPLETLQESLSAIEKQNVLSGSHNSPDEYNLFVIQNVNKSVNDLKETLKFYYKPPTDEIVDKFSTKDTSILNSLYEPLTELQQSLNQFEQQLLGSGVKAESTMANISLLAPLTEPLKDLTKEIMDVERRKISLSNDESTKADFSIYKLETFIKPIQQLQQGISLVQVSIPEISGKLSPETIALGTLVESLNHLKEQLKKIGNKINSSVLVVRASQPVINSFTNSISELQKGFELIELQAFLDSDEEPMSERESLSILEGLAHPLEKLRNSLVQIEEHCAEEGLDGIDNVALKFVTKVAPSVEEVLKGIALIGKQASLETDDNDNSISSHKPVQQPMSIKKLLHEIEQQIVVDLSSSIVDDNIANQLLKTMKQPIEDLQSKISKRNQEQPIETPNEQSSEESFYSLLDQTRQLTTPVQQLQQAIASVQQHGLSGESHFSTSSPLMELAQPIQELQMCVEQIEREIIPSSYGAINEVKKHLAHVEVQKVLENIDKSDVGITSEVKTSAVYLDESQKFVEPIEKNTPEKIKLSYLEQMENPLIELYKSLVHIEQKIILQECDRAMYDPDSFRLVTALAKPIDEVKRQIELLDDGIGSEKAAENIDALKGTSTLHTVTNPIQNLQQAISQLEQATINTTTNTMSDKTDLYLLKELAKPISEVKERISLVQEHAEIELNNEKICEKQIMSTMEKMSQPIHELLEALNAVQKNIMESVPQISENKATIDLNILAAPIQELKTGLEKLEKLSITSGKLCDSKASYALLKVIAIPMQELQKGIALAEKSEVRQIGGGSISEEANLILLKKLSKPLREMEKGLIKIEKQNIFATSIQSVTSDVTVVSNLATLTNIDGISKEFEILSGKGKTNVSETSIQDLCGKKNISEGVDEPNVSKNKKYDSELKELEETENKNEEECKYKGTEDIERKKDNAGDNEHKKIESEDVEVKTKVLEEIEIKYLETKEIKNKKKETKESVHKIKEAEEIKLKIIEVEEMECKLKESGDVELKNKESERIKYKNKEAGEIQKKKKPEDVESIKKESKEIERKKNEVEEIELNQKEVEEIKNQKKDVDDIEHKNKEAEEIENKNEGENEIEPKNKEAGVIECKTKEPENDKPIEKEAEDIERKKKDAKEIENKREEAEEIQRKKNEALKKKEAEDIKRKKKEAEKIEVKKKEEEIEIKNKEAEENDHTKNEAEESEIKSKEVDKIEIKREEVKKIELKNKSEEIETKRNAADEIECEKKEAEEIELKNKEAVENERKNEEVEIERKNKETEEIEIKRNKVEEIEIKRKEVEEIEIKRKAGEEIECKKKEAEEIECKNKETKEIGCKTKESKITECKKKEVADIELKNEEEEKELKNKEAEDITSKNKEVEEIESKNKQAEEIERKIKETEGNESKKKEAEEIERKNKEEEEIENKKKEAEGIERKKKEAEEIERKNKEAEENESKKKEAEEIERKNKEAEEIENKKKEAEEIESKKKEAKKLEHKKKEAEEIERKNKEEENEIKKKEAEGIERKKKEAEEIECKNKEAEEIENKKKEAKEIESKKKEAKKLERKKKEAEDIESKKKDSEEIKRKNKQAEEIERKNKEAEENAIKMKEEEEIERKKKEAEEIERKNKEVEENGIKRKEAEDIERKKKEAVEIECKKKEAEEIENKKKEAEEIESKKKEAKNLERKKKEAEEIERKKKGFRGDKKSKEIESKKKEAKNLERKKKEAEEIERKKKDSEEIKSKNKQAEEIECKNKDSEEIKSKNKQAEEFERKNKEAEENETKRKETEDIERKNKEAEDIERKKKEAEEIECKNKEAEEIENKKKEAKEIESKNKEAKKLERKKREAEEIERKKREAEEIERKKNEAEEIECKNKEAVEIERKNKEVEEIEIKKKEADEIEHKNKEAEENEIKRKEAENIERKKKEAEEIECKNKEAEEIENKNKEAEEIESIKKEAQEIEFNKPETVEVESKKRKSQKSKLKKKEPEEIESKMKEADEIKRKNKEAEENEIKRKEAEDIERKKKEAEKIECKNKEAEEIENKKKEAEEIESKKKEADEIESKKKEAEDNEIKRKEEEDIERKKKEAEEIECKKKEAEEIKIKKKEAEDIESKKKEAKKLEHKKKEAEEIERKKKDSEEIKSKNKQAEEIERKNKEEEENEIKKKEEEGIERKKKETKKLERKKKEAEEVERKKKDSEEIKRKNKQAEEIERKNKEAQENEIKMKEAEEIERKKKEAEEIERKNKEAEENEIKRKEAEDIESKNKEAQENEIKMKEAEEIERKKKEAEEIERKNKEAEENDIKRKEAEDIERKKKEAK